MEYRPRPAPRYGQNGYAAGQGNGVYGGGQGNSGYGGGQGNGGYAGPYSNSTYAGGQGNGAYGYGGGDGRYVPYGRGTVPVPSYGVGGGLGRLLAAAMPSTSRGWGAEEHLRGVGTPPPMILPEALWAAEAAAEEVVLRLHPTEAAERRRYEIIDYAKRLIGTTFGCEVHPYGSVPLRTYLPDGDVDVTVLTDTSLDSTFVEDLRHLLELEAQNDDAQFSVKNIVVIDAKVKIIKCVIDNVVMDISFNQIGGISTVLFLEKADTKIGKNHLFKRSIILIKAWCCHERQIHGSNRGLLSTYAIEVLTLCIFNMYHRSLNGPLEVLYKFLEYYSKFDWDKHYVTLNGPVPISSRQNLTEPAAFNDELLLSNEFLKSSLDRLIVLPIGSDRLDKDFLAMHVSILDPLEENNNLGRSINDDGFKRIKLAFECGARNLGQILKLPFELIPDGVYGFFATTLGRHGRGERQDLGESFLLRSMPNSGNVHGENVSSLENSCVDGSEKKCPSSLLELDNNESDVKPNMHQSSGSTNFRSHSSSSSESDNNSIKQCDHDSAANTDVPVARSYIQQNYILTSSPRANTLDVPCSCRVNNSNQTNVSQAKLQLPPFTPSNLLDLSGDLGLPLKCLRSAQYNYEALCDKLLESVKKTYFARELDENSFLRSLSETVGKELSTAKREVTRDVTPQPITEAQFDAPYQPFSGPHIPSSGLPVYPPPEAYDHTWFQNTEDTPQTYGVGMYNPDMAQNFSLAPTTDTLAIGPMFNNLAVSVGNKENYPFSSPYTTWDNRTTRGTGTYIPKTLRDLWKEKSWYDRRQNQRQRNQFNGGPDRVNPVNGNAPVERALTNGGIEQLPTSETRENGQQRYENGSMEMRTLPPPRIALPHHGGGSQGNLLVPSTGQPSPPAVTMETRTLPPPRIALPPPRIALPHHGGGSQGNLLVPSTGQPSPPAVTMVTPAAIMAPPAATMAPPAATMAAPAVTRANSQPIASQQHENLEFGTMGPFSPTRLTAKFIEDFPPLAGTKKPVQVKSPKPRANAAKTWPVEATEPTVQSPKAGVSATQSRPVEAPASKVQSPKPSESAAQCRPEEPFQLKDDADFPPLQAGTRYSADFPPLRAELRPAKTRSIPSLS